MSSIFISKAKRFDYSRYRDQSSNTAKYNDCYHQSIAAILLISRIIKGSCAIDCVVCPTICDIICLILSPNHGWLEESSLINQNS